MENGNRSSNIGYDKQHHHTTTQSSQIKPKIHSFRAVDRSDVRRQSLILTMTSTLHVAGSAVTTPSCLPLAELSSGYFLPTPPVPLFGASLRGLKSSTNYENHGKFELRGLLSSHTFCVYVKHLASRQTLYVLEENNPIRTQS